MRAVIYARISADDGRALGVARQEADCRGLCETRGWEVADVLVDNDVSAFSGRRRPGYETLLAGLRERRWDTLVVWHPDRLHRRPIELEEFIHVVETSGVSVSTVTAGDVDLSTPEGRVVARIAGAIARKESEDKSRRIQRKHRELAEQGLPSGGQRAFGYEADRVTLVPAEAAEIRAAVDRLLAGGSLRSIVIDWRDRVPTVTGGQWSRGTVQRILCSPRIAGLREHRGKVVGPGQWPAIVEPDELLRVQALFRTAPPGPRVRSYLLGGFVMCGKCKRQMATRPSRGTRRYVCTRDGGGCEGVGIAAGPLEELVSGWVVDRLEASEVPAEPARVDRAALEAVEARQVELAVMWGAGDITLAEWNAAKASLEARRDDLLVPAEPVVVFGGPGVREQWERTVDDIDARRVMIGSVLERVTIARSDRREGRFNPARVEPVWVRASPV